MYSIHGGFPSLIALFFLSLFASLVAAAPWGSASFSQPSGVHITHVSVDLKVPDVPTDFTSDDTIFVWAGVQPGAGQQDGDPANIGNGILVPSLTYGRSCAPGGNTRRNSWWISGSYFNVPATTSDSRYAGCHGGNVMAVEPGELISCTVVNTRGSIWIQTCSRPSGESVSYTVDMSGQQMNWASLSVFPGTDSITRLWNFPVYVYNYKFATSAPMSPDNCIVPASGDNFLTRGSSLSSDGMLCSLSAVVFWNTEASASGIASIPSL